MSFYDPKESLRRLRSGVVAAIKGMPAFFDDSRYPLIAVFSGEPDPGDEGRILAFQKFVGDSVSARPQVGFIRPACIRVGFSFPDAYDGLGKDLASLAETDRFEEVCVALGVVQVVCGGRHFRFAQRDFALDAVAYLAPSEEFSLHVADRLSTLTPN